MWELAGELEHATNLQKVHENQNMKDILDFLPKFDLMYIPI